MAYFKWRFLRTSTLLYCLQVVPKLLINNYNFFVAVKCSYSLLEFCGQRFWQSPYRKLIPPWSPVRIHRVAKLSCRTFLYLYSHSLSQFSVKCAYSVRFSLSLVILLWLFLILDSYISVISFRGTVIESDERNGMNIYLVVKVIIGFLQLILAIIGVNSIYLYIYIYIYIM